jgi:UDP-N-acetylglucosamine--N-acetylmuramyl-(pentapeptide) pyrophosphoryl-undecaprenol N-acetylglucosamine transferase
VAELTAAGRPAILVPYPSAADDHQRDNALAVEEAGGAWLMPEEAFTPEALAARLEAFLQLPASLSKAAEAARSVGRPEAAEKLARLVLKQAAIHREGYFESSSLEGGAEQQSNTNHALKESAA